MKRYIFGLILLTLNAQAMLISHRGVHQTYHREGLTNTTCTANRIDKTGHTYLENTIESIERAFLLGADMVEIDVHPTTEKNAPDELAVFHDWTLNCRTNASCSNGCNCNQNNECVTNKQSWSYLKSLDLGHGYTFDNGKSHPFRGKYLELMPLFEDVISLLEKHPNKRILVNVKGNIKRTGEAFLRKAKNYPIDIRSRLYYPYKYGHKDKLKQLGVEDHINQNARKCLFKYLRTGWYSHFPAECHNKRIFIPIRETLERIIGRPGRFVKVTSVLWGWPEKFIELAHRHGTKVYASQVDSIEEFNQMKELNLDGIMTNKIELIAPYAKLNYK